MEGKAFFRDVKSQLPNLGELDFSVSLQRHLSLQFFKQIDEDIDLPGGGQ